MSLTDFTNMMVNTILSASSKKKWLQLPPLFLFFTFIFLVCAHKVPPTGGPEDKISPTVVRHFPSADSVGINHLDYLEVEFSEPIRSSTLMGNYWIMPTLKNDFNVKWKGNKKVRFYFKDSLDKNQTYVFTLSPNIRDLRNNGLTQPFQLAFSTGPKLDRGSIRGKIYADQKQRDVYVYAYLLQPGQNLDSLIYTPPRYYTQVDADGSYYLNYLSLKKYRLLALVDQNYNRTYTVETDLVGLPFRDIELDSVHSHFTNINFYLIQEDTTRPSIKSIDTLSHRHLKITLSEQIKSSALFQVSLLDSLTGEKVTPIVCGLDPEQSDQLHLFIPELVGRRKMFLQLQGFSDLAGNELRPSQVSFFSSTRPDTSSSALRKIIPARGEREVPFSAPIVAIFSVPIDSVSYKMSFSLLAPDSSQIAGRFDFQNVLSPVFFPAENLKSNTTYQIRLALSTLKDWWQRSFTDTLIQQEFTTQDLANLGEIAGRVRSTEYQDLQAIIEAHPVRGNQVFRTFSRPDQSYQLDYLPDGQYLLQAIIDRNRNGRWDKGATMPWQFAEPFLVKTDTVRVRKRWTTQGIDLEFNFVESEK